MVPLGAGMAGPEHRTDLERPVIVVTKGETVGEG